MTTRKRNTHQSRRPSITPDTILRVAIYTRRSTDDEHQPYTIEAQTQKLHSYVDSQPGWNTVAEFTDNASGATTNRPGLQQLLRAARARRFDLILVYRLDRFSRRIRDLAALMDDLDQVGVAFRSATEPFDTSSPAGRLFVQMLGAFAEFEREIIIDRVVNGMERKAASGAWTNGPRPYGYLVDPTTKHLLPHPDERHIITEIFTTYAIARLGARSIALRLNAHGHRTRNGKPWSGHAILRILGNRLYLGEIAFRNERAIDAHEPLIDPATFDECTRIMNERGETHTKRASANSDYHLTGLITCPSCGAKYVGTSATGRLRSYRYYTCYRRARYGRIGCEAPRIDADLLDRAVLDALADFYGQTDLITEAITAEYALRAQDADRQTAEIKGLTTQITATNATIDRYLTAFENNTLDERTCGRRVHDLTTKLDQLTARRDELTTITTPPTTPAPQAIAHLRDDLAAIIANGTPGQRKALIETHIAKITIEGDILTPTFMIPTDYNHEPTTTHSDGGPTGDPVGPPFRTMCQVVEVAGIEPASADVDPGLLRAQPATAFLGPDDRAGTSPSWAQSLLSVAADPVTGPLASGLLADVSYRAEGEPGLTEFTTRSGGEGELGLLHIGSHFFVTRFARSRHLLGPLPLHRRSTSKPVTPLLSCGPSLPASPPSPRSPFRPVLPGSAAAPATASAGEPTVEAAAAG
jgi:site-specific DNA recombinase